MILPIYLYGSEVLRRENVDVDLNDKEGIATLLENMWETLANADGCGLAAPQVGVNKNLVIVDSWNTETALGVLAGLLAFLKNDRIDHHSYKIVKIVV